LFDACLARGRESLYRRHGTAGGTKEVTAVRVSLITALILSLGITAAAAVGLH